MLLGKAVFVFESLRFGVDPYVFGWNAFLLFRKLADKMVSERLCDFREIWLYSVLVCKSQVSAVNSFLIVS